MKTQTILIFGAIVAVGAALYFAFRRSAITISGGGDGTVQPALKLTDTTTGSGLGGSPNSNSDFINTRNQQGNDALSTGQLAPAGLTVDNSTVAQAALYPITLVREQDNVVTGGKQRIFRSNTDNPDPVSAARGFITDGAFIERLPTGSGSTAPNVIEIGTASHSSVPFDTKQHNLITDPKQAEKVAAQIRERSKGGAVQGVSSDKNAGVSLGSLKIKSVAVN